MLLIVDAEESQGDFRSVPHPLYHPNTFDISLDLTLQWPIECLA